MSKSSKKTLSSRIVRIENDFLRFVLWSVWYPVVAIRFVIGYLNATWKENLGFQRRFVYLGDTLTTFYIVGIDGFPNKKD